MDYTLARVRSDLTSAAQQLLGVDRVVVEDANANFDADLAIPCFAVANELNQDPNAIAQRLADGISHESVESMTVKSGFVNIRLKPKFMAEAIIGQAKKPEYGRATANQGQTILVEFTDPNPFKPLHIGHLYSNTVGESIARLLEYSGATVHRVSYHGDVGLHIAMAVWGVMHLLGDSQQLSDIAVSERAHFLGQAYATGTKAYQEKSTKVEIDNLNKKLYAINDAALKEIYETGRQWSFEYFDTIYDRLGVKFERQYFESQTGPKGLEIVRANIGEVFAESDGAVVFKGEDEGLHTRVFINSQGLPTYEAKDLALAFVKDEDYHYDLSIIITAHEQAAYFSVMI
jgi:arginyl-tRNA synthetase